MKGGKRKGAGRKPGSKNKIQMIRFLGFRWTLLEWTLIKAMVEESGLTAYAWAKRKLLS